MEIQYYNTNDFLSQMERLEYEYKNIEYYYKFIPNLTELREQFIFLEKCEVLSANGFRKDHMIKITVSANNKKIVVCYKFRDNTNVHYDRMNYFLRKLEQQR